MKSFRDLVEAEESEEVEEITSIEDYEEIYEDIVEDITEMKTYAKELGLTNEQVNPLVEALQAIDKVDDLIRSMFDEEDFEESDEEEDDRW